MNTEKLQNTLVINGYEIKEVYTNIAIGVDTNGTRKCFRKIDLLMSQATRDKIEEYWEALEAEFRRGQLDIAYGF